MAVVQPFWSLPLMAALYPARQGIASDTGAVRGGSGGSAVLRNSFVVAAKFHCSEEEALRGLTAGEQLYWGGVG